MLAKNYSKTGRACRVTFSVLPNTPTDRVSLCGEFNGWDAAAHPMARRKDGRFSATVTLNAPQSYRFRYRLDDGQWQNDEAADGYAANSFGSDDSIVTV